MPDIDAVRAKFPALASDFAYLENAGGSQVPRVVVDAIRDYMTASYVQLGAGYPQSNVATNTVDEAHSFMTEFVNAPAEGRIVLGSSTTALIQLIANAYSKVWKQGDEVLIAESNHEANAGAWARLESRGIRIKHWPVNPETFRCEPSALPNLLSDRTRIVALPHVSNLIGQIEDVAQVADIAHQAGARVFADGVAFAPHRAIDVQALGVDWYAFSAYKVYGPHMAVLYGRADAFDELEGPNHWFVPNQDPYKWELGGVSHEACAGLLALKQYFAFLAEGPYVGRITIERAFSAIQSLESEPETRLRGWLSQRSDLRVLGPKIATPTSVPTVSFIHRSLSSDALATHLNQGNLGIRNGHMYAVRLLECLGVRPDPGVVRISLVHYNTLREVERVIDKLEKGALRPLFK